MRSYDKPLYLIERKNPKTGFKEQITFLGTRKEKPKGWKIIKQLSK